MPYLVGCGLEVNFELNSFVDILGEVSSLRPEIRWYRVLLRLVVPEHGLRIGLTWRVVRLESISNKKERKRLEKGNSQSLLHKSYAVCVLSSEFWALPLDLGFSKVH